MLLFFVGWFVLAVFLALLIGSAIHQGARLSDAPDHVSRQDWERVSHVPHTPGFQRVLQARHAEIRRK